MSCSECSAPLVGMYSNAITCSEACRAKRSRRLRKLVTTSYADACRRMAARDVAEMEIEARRDAEANNFDISANPYNTATETFSALMYDYACTKNWKTKLENGNVTDRKANG